MSHINSSRLVEHFLELIQIDSESGNELAISEHLAQQLTELGFDVQKRTVTDAVSNGHNLYAKLKGSLEGSILMSCHMDTVTPGNGIKPVIDDGIIRSEGNTILGGDDKSGIAAIMEAVKAIQEAGLPHKTIELAFTVHEEGGLHGSRQFDIRDIESDCAIVLDSSGDIGTIITQAPGQQSFKITITGKPAHAGLAPEQGINALTVASEAISKMNLSRIDEETTANIGVVKGGNATNIVLPELYLEAEARSLNDEKLSAQVAHMETTFQDAADAHGAQIKIESCREYVAYQIDEAHPLVDSIKRAFEQCDLMPRTKSTGGGSDANIFNAKGLTTVNLATGMSKVHTTEEQIAIDDLFNISRFVEQFLTQ